MSNPLMTAAQFSELEKIASKINIQATCLERYAEERGYTSDSIFHIQAGHFHDLAAEMNAVFGKVNFNDAS